MNPLIMNILEIAFCLVALVLSVPIVFLFIEFLGASLSLQVFPPINEEIRPSATILIPAHNEAEVIGQSLDSLFPQLMPCDRIVVIADNCSDKTAEIVQKKGITVIERDNTEHRGKGYAIDYGIKYLSNHPPDIVVILDADCFMEAETLDHLVTLA